jgi:crotonobetainyl-CoA:carnitine CoA-transferase CaiB-like acyl-CoA transferase
MFLPVSLPMDIALSIFGTVSPIGHDEKGAVMTGILDGVRVVDVTDGIAGPITTMLFADQGADVLRVEVPGAARPRAGDVVWQRGKRRVALDPSTPAGHASLLDIVSRADVLVESFRPALASALGLEHGAFSAVNPRLVHTSITAYGRDTASADRPDLEWLVTARTGLQFDQRGWYGTRMDHIMGLDLHEPGFDVPPGADQLGCREGPIFLAVPWASLACAFLATAATSAGLYVADRTGSGQHVETSLVQAVINMNAMGWQRVATMHPSYRLWYFDRRAPKGVFQGSDGRWLHQWAPFEHTLLRANAAGVDPDSVAPVVIAGGDYETSVRAQAEAYVPTSVAVATRPVDEWVRLGAEAVIGLQPIRSPEDALFDKPLEGEGVIVELDDPELGPIRQVGHVYGFDGVENPPIAPRAATALDVEAAASAWAPRPPLTSTPVPDAPLDGIVVLDFGLAIAGPFGAQILADLGATVIKVTTLGFDLTDAIYVGSSRGKEALAVDLKHPRGQEIAARLIAGADVVHHNMRTGVAERLGIGYEQARTIKPSIIYCHTRGFERNGPRTHLPGNDQLGHALAGSAYEAGGTHHGTPPIWQMCAYGDTGNGVMSAAAVVQALRHRDRTGEGQFVHTSILNVCMLFNSFTYAFPDGTGPERERIDAEQYGFSPVQRLYETADGWLCLFVTDEAQRRALFDALDVDTADSLGTTFALKDAQHWFDVLDAAGVPCEVISSTYARELFDDPAMHDRGWVARSEHQDLGTMDHVAMPFSFSASSRQNVAGAPVTGEHTRAVLAAVGYGGDEIDALIAAGVVRQR